MRVVAAELACKGKQALRFLAFAAHVRPGALLVFTGMRMSSRQPEQDRAMPEVPQ